MEERSKSVLSEPSYTNRRVTRQKNSLTALIDWCQITVKDVDLFTVITDILKIPLSLMELQNKGKGIAGHELVAGFDNIKILKPTGKMQYNGFQILMSGSGCRNYENFLVINKETWFDFFARVCQYHVNFPRIDLAIDDHKPYLNIPELIRLTKQGLISSQLRNYSENASGTEDKYRDENNKWIVAVKEHAKTDAGNRDLIISSTALDTLNQILELNTSGTYLFEHNGKRIRGNTFNKRLSRICNELHIPHRTMHKIRKTYGTTLIDSDVDEGFITEQMGHSDISTTKKLYYFSNKTTKNKEKQIENAISF